MTTPDWTREEPAPGLCIWQPRRGYRYAMDPFLLAAWCLEGGMPRTAVDLGCGSGVMALLLARLGVATVGVDVRPEWIPMARQSAEESHLDARFILADIRDLPPAAFDLALLNPPYFKVGHGPIPPEPTRAAARLELHGVLDALVSAAARQAPRVGVVLPRTRTREGRSALAQAGLVLARLCYVEPSLVLFEARCPPADAGPVEVATMREGGTFSPRVREWYARLGAHLEGGHSGQ